MMKQSGFFSQDQIRTLFPIENKKRLLLPECERCGMYRGCLNPRLQPSGKGELKTLIIAEANGPDEDTLGTQLIGDTGQFFRNALQLHHLDLERDFWRMNAVNCFPHKDGREIRKPTKVEITCCRPMIDQAIEKLKPKFIWLLGGVAVESFYLYDDFEDYTISRWRNLCIPDSRYKAYVFPQFHPSFALRQNTDENLQAVYERDLAFAVDRIAPFLEDPLPDIVPVNHEEECVIYKDFNIIIEALDYLIKAEPKYLFFDYETNALKAQRPGSKIATVSLNTLEPNLFNGKTIAFPFQYADYFTPEEQLAIKARLRKIMSNANIGKISHNIQFEDSWSRNILKVPVKNWEFDTMIVAHILDCRKKFTGLKFQTYINFGIYPYDSKIKPFLDDHGNYFNEIDKAPLDPLLLYNALDSHFLRLLFKKQLGTVEVLDRKGWSNIGYAIDFFHEGSLAFCDVHNTGIHMDEEHYESTRIALDTEYKNLEKKLLEGEEAKRFHKENMRKLKLTSSKDLSYLYSKILNLPASYTEKGNMKLDKQTVGKDTNQFTKDLLKLRQIDKVLNTYLAEFQREVVNGMMYPLFGLNIPVSYRSSSSRPNFQNVPVRDEEAKRYTRQGIIPRPGNRLLEADYSRIEVCIAACYTRDPSLVKYVSDPSTDMHRDSAADIWILPIKEVSKMIRFYAKNGWVFPEFYGSYYGTCAQNLWEEVAEAGLKTVSGIPVIEHMQEFGINNLSDFTEHCRSVENIFWNERFKVYKQWKDDIQVEIQNKGFIETYLGFRYSGYLTYNQVCNYPIQGTAFHCLLWTLIEILRYAKLKKWVTKIIGQIHDSIIFDLYPPELDEVVETVKTIGVKRLREYFPWIIVPLEIEMEMTEVDQSWYYKKELKQE